jgi:hypothetical protein
MTQTKNAAKQKRYRQRKEAEKGKEVRGIHAKDEYHERIKLRAEKLIKHLDGLTNTQED